MIVPFPDVVTRERAVSPDLLVRERVVDGLATTSLFVYQGENTLVAQFEPGTYACSFPTNLPAAFIVGLMSGWGVPDTAQCWRQFASDPEPSPLCTEHVAFWQVRSDFLVADPPVCFLRVDAPPYEYIWSYPVTFAPADAWRDGASELGLVWRTPDFQRAAELYTNLRRYPLPDQILSEVERMLATYR